MGYQHRAWTMTYGNCGLRWLWTRESEPRRIETDVRCRCGARNEIKIKDLSPWPNVPRALYIGHKKHKQLKLYPVPPESSGEAWALPYSIRSFVSQASDQLGSCVYRTFSRGKVMGEEVFSDKCWDSRDALDWAEGSICHMVAGWTAGEATCALWEKVQEFCQTEAECKFLHWYLGLAKDRHFPMLIPQARIGIAERRRPDFVLFVPLQYWRYKWLAIQLDKAHSEEMADKDELRDAEISVHGYEVINLRPENKGYFEEVQKLVERVEQEMLKFESDPWSVAVDVPVVSTKVEEDVPF